MLSGNSFQAILFDTEDFNRCWNDVGVTFQEIRDELLELCENVQKIMKAAIFGEEPDNESEEEPNASTPPKQYGASLRRPSRIAFAHYNYIPRTPRNLPYQRRAY